MISSNRNSGVANLFVLFIFFALNLFSIGVSADSNNTGGDLGNVHNEVAKSLISGTKYDNIVNIGCGWASGVNFASGVDWTSALPAIYRGSSRPFVRKAEKLCLLFTATRLVAHLNVKARIDEAAGERAKQARHRCVEIVKIGRSPCR